VEEAERREEGAENEEVEDSIRCCHHGHYSFNVFSRMKYDIDRM
jgi:hypothetical protein